MNFIEYLNTEFNTKNGTINSYIKAIEIIDSLFQRIDPFKLRGQSILNIKDAIFIEELIEYICDEENKFKRGENSIFNFGSPNQSSYPRKGFCRAAIKKYGEYLVKCYTQEVNEIMLQDEYSGIELSTKLIRKFNLKAHIGETEIVATVKLRLGQNFFRNMLLTLYNNRCCITGIEIPSVLRASHIIPWFKDSFNRLNPENGLCFSATYDAAFDKYLISLDEDYRIILSKKNLKDLYSSEAFKKFFLEIEGQKINLPKIYKPSQDFLSIHREKLLT